MTASQRRQEILSCLNKEQTPISATTLAQTFGVSRQVVVGDIALLRAAGAPIAATPRGYLLDIPAIGILHTVAVRHTNDQMERELQICVDNGCTVVDVLVEHPVYGQLVGQLQLSNRYDVEQFLRRAHSGSAHPLSDLTDGIHLHTLRCPSEDAYQRVCAQLDQEGFLLKD